MSESEPNELPLIRWLKPRFSYEQLQDKTIFAQFVTRSGESYKGEGKIRVRENPAGLLAIDLVFTRHDSHDVRTDIIFHLSSRQFEHIRKAPEAPETEHDFEYDGILAPDNQPETTPEV
jgi:hypothetical protein